MPPETPPEDGGVLASWAWVAEAQRHAAQIKAQRAGVVSRGVFILGFP